VHPVLQSAQAEILNLQKDIRKHAPTHDNKNNITKHLKVVDRVRFGILKTWQRSLRLHAACLVRQR
jgi:hypothetical protein